MEPKDSEDVKFDFNLDVCVDPDTFSKELHTTHLQVHLWAFDFSFVTDMVHAG